MMTKLFRTGLMIAATALLVACGGEAPAPEASEVADASATPAVMLTGDKVPTQMGDLTIHPINHATVAMQWNGKTIYTDPVGGAERYEGLPKPDIVLITDVHGDHLNADTLQAVVADNTVIVAPAAVVEMLPETLSPKSSWLANGAQMEMLGINIEAIPMYNTTEDRLQYHEKGRGNGYVLTLGGTRVYLSGDTEDIPEMRALQNIDVAFICFNLPYTMTEEQAANAVLAFKPRIVYPYHYQGSDVDKFAMLVGEGNGIEVRRGAWYED